MVPHFSRPTNYRGTLMRSRLEAHFASHLDDCSQEWLYEPLAYADRDGQYLPDFCLPHVHAPLTDPGDGWGFQSMFFEVKGPEQSPLELAALQRKMMTILDSEPMAQLAIATEDWMRRGVFLMREAPQRDGLPISAWEWGAWGECRCATVGPVVVRGGSLYGSCPDCGSSVFPSRRRLWLPETSGQLDSLLVGSAV